MAVTDDEERLEGDSGTERGTTLFNEQPGEEDEEAWHEHAARELHPSAGDE